MLLNWLRRAVLQGDDGEQIEMQLDGEIHEATLFAGTQRFIRSLDPIRNETVIFTIDFFQIHDV